MLKAAFRNSAIYIYNQRVAGGGSGNVKKESTDNLRLKYTSGGLSDTAKKDIRRRVDNWQWAVVTSQKLWSAGRERRRRYFVMVTLTLPSKQTETDNVVKRRYLNTWLLNLERVYNGINWLWVAEAQKNGNIHFHVIVDRWVNWGWVQGMWNKVLSNGGYIDAFQAKHKHRNPPTTDVCGQKKMSNPAAYITKYLTGDKWVRDIEGRKWGCCDKLREIDRWALPGGDEIEQWVIENFAPALADVRYGSHSTAYFFRKGLLPSGLWDKFLRVFDTWVCRSLSAFYEELAECIPEDLPLAAFYE